jgi:hypothetical protein
MSETHIIKLPKRTGKLEVVEEPTRIVLKLRFDKYGVFGDEAELEKWMLPIFEKYDTDKRPLVMDNPTTGEVATVFGDASDSIVIMKFYNP